jgi:predicted nucleic acid-binding protein
MIKEDEEGMIREDRRHSNRRRRKEYESEGEEERMRRKRKVNKEKKRNGIIFSNLKIIKAETYLKRWLF